MKHYYKKMKSPVGELKLIASDKGLVAVLWERDNPQRIPIEPPIEDEKHPILIKAEQQLNEYFDERRDTFPINLDINGTEFQKKVWDALLTIPFGETRTYGEIAQQIGDIKSVRAVGGAVNKNPISIILPCHRVIGASGKLVGFAGGLENKAILLRLEGKRKNPTLF